MIESAAALCLMVALVSVGALLRVHRELDKARARCAVLDTVPLEWFGWRTGGTIADGPSKASDYRRFLAGLLAADAAHLEKARQALQAGGTSFSLTFSARGGRASTVEGRRAASGDIVLWILDASAAMMVQTARQEAADLRRTLDLIPLPVWRRGADRTLVDCNRAYASAVDATPDLAVAEGRQLVADARNGECRHVIIGGSRRLVEIGEVPCPAGGTIGFAVDRTDREAAEAELWRHVNAHAEVLETIRASVAIYGPDKKHVL